MDTLRGIPYPESGYSSILTRHPGWGPVLPQGRVLGVKNFLLTIWISLVCRRVTKVPPGAGWSEYVEYPGRAPTETVGDSPSQVNLSGSVVISIDRESNTETCIRGSKSHSAYTEADHGLLFRNTSCALHKISDISHALSSSLWCLQKWLHAISKVLLFVNLEVPLSFVFFPVVHLHVSCSKMEKYRRNIINS